MKFVHIPKTAGMSICSTYKDQKWGLFDTSLRQIGVKDNVPAVHNPIVMKEVYKDHITFCVVRNPITRLLSAYRYRNLPDDPNELNATLTKWKIEVINNPHCFMNHIYPQYHFANFCTHVLKYENLEIELNALLKKYNIPIRQLQRTNTPRKQYSNISINSISKENILWIREYYKEDFELYKNL